MLHAKKKVVNDFSTPDSGILAHMILTPTGDGKVKLEGYPMNASPKYQLSDKRTRRTSLDISKIELDIRDLAAVVARKYNKEHRPKAPQMPKTRGYIVEALQRCPNIYDEANYPDWGKTTTKGSVDYLIHSIAPAMDRIGGDICDEDMERIKEEMIEHAYGSRRAKHNKDGSVNAKRMDTARTGVDNRFRRAGIVYHWARKACPELELPDVKFPQGEKVKKIKTEQAKALPDDVRVRFATLIFTLCSLGVTLAFGTALEFFGGLRVAEAAAPLIGELCLLPDDDFRFGKYFVAHQIVDGKRVQYLKRDSSYRHVPLTLAMVSLVEMKISQLMEDGYKRGEIYEMPFVSTPGDAERAADPDQLAAFAKELLILAGCDDQYMYERGCGDHV
jgi:hypothetical protein